MQSFFNSISNVVSNVNVSRVTNLKTVTPTGYNVQMKSTSSKHFNYVEKSTDSPNFLNYLTNSINGTNNALVNAEFLQQQLIEDPDNTNIDEVTIAAKEAEIALNLTKSVINKLITGYKELINIR
ncbi:MAG: flagellar hook-basal body complex protein FliE [Spirochaetales bacterium]|nr:flagellar hook-basal body complex protein FliE [Exilispira sp.]NMC67604.1 flagellar hook-basal body complex protein FliE [Spirochaetales bacterium]